MGTRGITRAGLRWWPPQLDETEGSAKLDPTSHLSNLTASSNSCLPVGPTKRQVIGPAEMSPSAVQAARQHPSRTAARLEGLLEITVEASSLISEAQAPALARRGSCARRHCDQHPVRRRRASWWRGQPDVHRPPRPLPSHTVRCSVSWGEAPSASGPHGLRRHQPHGACRTSREGSTHAERPGRGHVLTRQDRGASWLVPTLGGSWRCCVEHESSCR